MKVFKKFEFLSNSQNFYHQKLNLTNIFETSLYPNVSSTLNFLQSSKRFIFGRIETSKTIIFQIGKRRTKRSKSKLQESLTFSGFETTNEETKVKTKEVQPSPQVILLTFTS